MTHLLQWQLIALAVSLVFGGIILWLINEATRLLNDCTNYCDRLDRIAAEEKPTSNATVRRMARIARGEEW